MIFLCYYVFMTKAVIVTFLVTLLTTVFLFAYYQRMNARPGEIVIPAGNTYLGEKK